MRIQTMAPLFAHSGLDDVIKLWSDKQPKIYSKIAKAKPTNEYYFRTASAGDLPVANPVTEARGITFAEYRTPFYKDWFPTKMGLGFAASTEAEETDQYGEIGKKSSKMLQSMEWAREISGSDFINLATSASFVGPDGQPLASASHPLASGVASNIISGNPSLSYDSLEDAVQTLLQTQTDQGNFWMFMGPFVLYVHPSQYLYALRLIHTQGIAGTFNKDTNEVSPIVTQVVQSPYFSSTTAWALRSVSDAEHGLMFVNRRGNIPKTQYDITKDANLYTLTAIWCTALEDWRGFVYSDGLGG